MFPRAMLQDNAACLQHPRHVDWETMILVTGAAGFIGFHVCLRLLQQGFGVVGLDNLNDYYDPKLKRDRLRLLLERGMEFHPIDLCQEAELTDLFIRHGFSRVVHLAAQAGVRYSKTNPQAYVSSNLLGFLNILEACRRHAIGHLIYASSSSVYGLNTQMPLSTRLSTDTPVSLYGATKKSNELMAHSYAWTFGLPCTGLRFFTVYGPWGRPDMALYVFANAILERRPVQLFNHGNMLRDFTFVDDVVESITRLLHRPPVCQPGQSAPTRIFNVGNHNPVNLRQFLSWIEEALGQEAQVELAPLQTGDIVDTFADVQELEQFLGFRPATPVREGIRRSLEWYLEYRTRSNVEVSI